MYYDYKVKIPEVKGKIYERTIKGVVYINYEYDRIYKPDKKYNIPKRTTIGKKCGDDPEMMYPNPNFLTYFQMCIRDSSIPDVSWVRDSAILQPGYRQGFSWCVHTN